MNETVNFQCKITNTDTSAALGMEILLDGTSMFKINHVAEVCDVEFAINDEPATRRLEFVMTGKHQDHTKIDKMGNILSDALLEISQIIIDDVQLGPFVFVNAAYHHDFNGTKSAVKDKFFGAMGCNGKVVFEFNTPIYLWLLENL